MIVCVCAFVLASLVSAQDPHPADAPRHDLPPVIFTGFHAFRDKGAIEALREWAKGGPIEGKPDVLIPIGSLRQAADKFGAFKDFDVLGMQEISPRVRNYYLVLNYERGPLFAKFAMYRSEDAGWVLLGLTLDFDSAKVLPQPGTPALASPVD
jgi:hypothetical protein